MTTTLLKGRQKILSEFKSDDLRDLGKLAQMLTATYASHLVNKVEIDYLMDYRNGIQPILQKTKTIRPEINNQLVINHAQMITRAVIGYFLGTPIQYIQSGSEKKQQIDMLNKFVMYEDKASVDKEIGEYQSICGTAYRIIYTDGQYGDEVPFEDKALNPSTTYIVYENTIAEKPLAGITYHNVYNEKGTVIGVKAYVYTDFGVYTVVTKGVGFVSKTTTIELSPYSVGGVPIIEYPNNMWRIGDWELCIGLMNAIADIQSGRLDDIDQIVQSLLIFINAEIDQDRYDEMRASGIVSMKNTTGVSADVKTVDNTLDQTSIGAFSQELEDMLYALIGIPSRNNRSGGGGDTGQAVELRDGWADLEIVARNKELVYKKSEKQSLRIILTILNNKMGFDLSLLDVDIKFSRNKNNNLLVKTQSYQTLLLTKTLSPADCLTIVDLVSDVNEFISRGQAFWGDGFAGQIKEQLGTEMAKVQLDTAKNSPDPATPAKGVVK